MQIGAVHVYLQSLSYNARETSLTCSSLPLPLLSSPLTPFPNPLHSTPSLPFPPIPRTPLPSHPLPSLLSASICHSLPFPPNPSIPSHPHSQIELQEELAITDFKGDPQGHLSVEILPCKLNGALPTKDEDLFVEDPDMLV